MNTVVLSAPCKGRLPYFNSGEHVFRQPHLIDGLLYFYSAEYAFRQLLSIDGFDIPTRACLLSNVFQRCYPYLQVLSGLPKGRSNNAVAWHRKENVWV